LRMMAMAAPTGRPPAPAPALDDVVFPGDAVAKLPASGEVKVGTGVVPGSGYLVANRTGLLRSTVQVGDEAEGAVDGAMAGLSPPPPPNKPAAPDDHTVSRRASCGSRVASDVMCHRRGTWCWA